MNFNRRQTLIIAAATFLLSILVSFIISLLQKPKLAYVQTAELMEGYIGMKQARLDYEKKTIAWTDSIDQFEAAIQQNREKLQSLPARERTEGKQAIEKQQARVDEYAERINNRASEAEEAMRDKVSKDVNAFIAAYGRNNGYIVVLGTAPEGNILYADTAVNITAPLLRALNEAYVNRH